MNGKKENQRRMALSRRHSLQPTKRERASNVICRQIMQLPEVYQAKVILSYMAMPDEPNLAELHEKLWREGKALAFPVTEGRGIMHAVKAERHGQWRIGHYGICEPIGETVNPAVIDLVIAPCVAFDEQCHRLGHGGGYYDRFLNTCPQAACIVAAFDVQKSDEVCVEMHDRTVDKVITETYIFSKENNDGFKGKDIKK